MTIPQRREEVFLSGDVSEMELDPGFLVGGISD